MKILFTRFPLVSLLGGAEIQTLSLMEGLRKRGHEVLFLGSCPILLKECFERGFKTIPVHIGSPPVTKWRALTFPFWRGRAKKKLLKALESITDIDAVCMLSLTEKLIATESLHDRHIPVVWIEHDRIGRWLRKNPALPELLRLSRLAKTVAVSQLTKKLYLEIGFPEDRVLVIPNGIDPHRFPPIPHTPPEGGKILRIGCIARLSEEKGIDLLIDAVRHVPDGVLTIVGHGPLQKALTHLIDQINQSEPLPRIALLPHVDDLASFYRSIDALVLPSRDHDPFGLVAAEAMLLGIPVIVTTKTGIADELTHQHDALVVEPTSEAIKNAILQLQSPYLRSQLAENGKKTAREKFSLQLMIDGYEKVLTSARER